MLLIGFLLIPMVLAADAELKINDYIIKIENGTLKSVRETSESSTHLDLSDLRIDALDANVFDNVINVKSLDLSNNAIVKLPQFVFANLTKLKKLSLRNNRIAHGLKFVFSNLGSLKSLDISNNLIDFVDHGYFFGLDKSCYIFLQGNPIARMATDILEKPSVRYINIPDRNKAAIDYTRAKVCIKDGTVKLVDFLKKWEILKPGCFASIVVEHRRNTWYPERHLNLRNLNISKVAPGWFRAEGWFIHTVDLSENNISRVTSELVNDLPSGVEDVILSNNKIERLEKGIMKTDQRVSLDLSNNLIHDIEDGAFADTNFLTLNLNGNRLKNTTFLTTLPTSIRSLNLGANEISEISDGLFSKNFYYLENLDLSHNKITELRSKSLRGLIALQNLNMTNNRLRKIEQASFRDLLYLDNLDLSNNNLSSLAWGVFAGFGKLHHLNLSANKLTEIMIDWLFNLPTTLRTLILDYNEIENLQAGTFRDVPREILSLEGNKISKIEKGAFAISSLKELSLRNNSLNEFDVDSWEGLPALEFLSVALNNLTSVKVGDTKNLLRLKVLELSDNPIKRFENGALYGLREGIILLLQNVPVESVQAGLLNKV